MHACGKPSHACTPRRLSIAAAMGCCGLEGELGLSRDIGALLSYLALTALTVQKGPSDPLRLRNLLGKHTPRP